MRTSPAAENLLYQRSDVSRARRDTTCTSTVSARVSTRPGFLIFLSVVVSASADARYSPVRLSTAPVTSASLEARRGVKTVRIATLIWWPT